MKSGICQPGEQLRHFEYWHLEFSGWNRLFGCCKVVSMKGGFDIGAFSLSAINSGIGCSRCISILMSCKKFSKVHFLVPFRLGIG